MQNRLTWEQTKLWLKQRGPGWFSVIEFDSGLYVNCHSLYELHTTVCASPSFRENPAEALKRLRFYQGRPIMAISSDAADNLRSHRKKMKYQDISFISDKFGGLIMDRELPFDVNTALADYAMFIEARKKINELQHPTNNPARGSEEPAPAGHHVSSEVSGIGSSPATPSGSNAAPSGS